MSVGSDWAAGPGWVDGGGEEEENKAELVAAAAVAVRMLEVLVVLRFRWQFFVFLIVLSCTIQTMENAHRPQVALGPQNLNAPPAPTIHPVCPVCPACPTCPAYPVLPGCPRCPDIVAVGPGGPFTSFPVGAGFAAFVLGVVLGFASKKLRFVRRK
ncbi:hypothetical protein F4779DRAFT_619072 [Xylariaceae sp. FL0662B]|nr:hypothetical protein F4779DRAFT_619072 [Xylariaceae sp. FL0662B]